MENEAANTTPPADGSPLGDPKPAAALVAQTEAPASATDASTVQATAGAVAETAATLPGVGDVVSLGGRDIAVYGVRRIMATDAISIMDASGTWRDFA